MKRRRWEEVKNKNAIRDPLLKRTLEKKTPPPLPSAGRVDVKQNRGGRRRKGE